jgi:long-subunit acyl-CoA synthetase (AMP-forming)
MTGSILDLIGRAPTTRIALQDGARSLSYGELTRAVKAEAHWQSEYAGKRVAVLADNGCNWIVADLALLARGALNVPLPSYFTPAQLQHALNDASIDAVLTGDPRRASDICADFQLLSHSPVTGLALLTRRTSSADVPILHDAAKVTYTSGSTADPKGVCLSVTSLERVTASLVTALRPLGVGRHLCLLPLPTLLENIAGVYVPLCLGATCHVPSVATTGMSYGGLDAGLLLGSISRARPESLIVVPELLRVLVAAVERGWAPPSTLEFIAVGGAVVSPELLEEAASVGLPVYEGYGLSECASVVCLNTPEASRRGSVGKPLPHAGVRVDGTGQLHVRGALMSGYVGRPAIRGEEEFATGDLGEIDDDGFVYVRGRLKNIFISSMGRNVSPEWIEREIERDCCIARAVVFGEGRARPLAVLQPVRPDASDHDLERAVGAANSGLPDYAQIERWIRADTPLTFQSGLLTANGRPRRDAIAARHRHALKISGTSVHAASFPGA